MIWELLIDFILDTFDSMLTYVPTLEISVPQSAFNGLRTLTANIGYILPVDDLLDVFSVWCAYMAFRLGCTFYKHRIKIRA